MDIIRGRSRGYDLGFEEVNRLGDPRAQPTLGGVTFDPDAHDEQTGAIVDHGIISKGPSARRYLPPMPQIISSIRPEGSSARSWCRRSRYVR